MSLNFPPDRRVSSYGIMLLCYKCNKILTQSGFLFLHLHRLIPLLLPMRPPVIVIKNATQTMAAEILENAAQQASGQGFSLRMRLCPTGEKYTYAVTFPCGIGILYNYLETFSRIHIATSCVEDDTNNPVVSIYGVFDGGLAEGSRKISDDICVTMNKDYDFEFTSQNGKNYTEDADEEDELLEKLSGNTESEDSHSHPICLKEDPSISNQYMPRPERIEAHGIINGEDFCVQAQTSKSQAIKQNASCLGGIILLIAGAALLLGALKLMFYTDCWINPPYAAIAVFVLTAIICIIKPSDSPFSGFAKFQHSFEHHIGKSIFIVSATVCAVLGANILFSKGDTLKTATILPQTEEEKITVRFDDGSTTNFENKDNIKKLKGKKECRLVYEQGGLGIDIYKSIYDVK